MKERLVCDERECELDWLSSGISVHYYRHHIRGLGGRVSRVRRNYLFVVYLFLSTFDPIRLEEISWLLSRRWQAQYYPKKFTRLLVITPTLIAVSLSWLVKELSACFVHGLHLPVERKLCQVRKEKKHDLLLRTAVPYILPLEWFSEGYISVYIKYIYTDATLLHLVVDMYKYIDVRLASLLGLEIPSTFSVIEMKRVALSRRRFFFSSLQSFSSLMCVETRKEREKCKLRSFFVFFKLFLWVECSSLKWSLPSLFYIYEWQEHPLCNGNAKFFFFRKTLFCCFVITVRSKTTDEHTKWAQSRPVVIIILLVQLAFLLFVWLFSGTTGKS